MSTDAHAAKSLVDPLGGMQTVEGWGGVGVGEFLLSDCGVTQK